MKKLYFRGRPCYYGETPLAFACCTNQWHIAEILLKHGASMDAVSYQNNHSMFFSELIKYMSVACDTIAY
jgi:ankyrin repeat protein